MFATTNHMEDEMELERVKAHTQLNLDAFYEELKAQYAELFANDPEYAYSAAHISPADLARKMTLGLDSGSANKDGKAITRACKKFGIPHTYKAIRCFFNAQ